MLTDPYFTSMAQDQLNYNFGIFLLVVGIFLFIVGFLGCCGILRESKCLLVLFFCVLLLILVAEISAAVWAYTNKDGFESLVKENVKKTVSDEYGDDSTKSQAFDYIQNHLQCCGGSSPTDWQANSHASKDKVFDMTKSSSGLYKIPKSCCKSFPNDACKKLAEEVGWVIVSFSPQIEEHIYFEGCGDKLIDWFYSFSTYFFIVGFVLMLIQLCGLIFLLIICCSMEKPHYSSINSRNQL